MAPFIEAETNPADLRFAKFVRDGERIAYDDAAKGHSEIAEEYGLGSQINGSQLDEPELLVDDAGNIEPTDFNDRSSPITFTGHSITCALRGNRSEARQQTTTIGKRILGDDKVAG